MKYFIETEEELRDYFWLEHPEFTRMECEHDTQNNYKADVRQAWCFFLDGCERSKIISMELSKISVL